MNRIAFALLAAAIAAPAAASDSPAAQDAAAKKKPHLICKRDENTGSHLTKRVCRTAEEWAGTSVDDDQDRLGGVSRQATTRDTGATMSRDPR